MKKIKKLKLALMILISILIILVGFVGIYSKQSNSYKDVLPEYQLASDLKGSTVLEFEIDDGTETIYYDEHGHKVDSSEVTEENKDDYTTKEILINAEENLTTENYKKALNIMEKRLEFLKVDQYRLDLDEKTGKIILTFEYDYPDDIKSFLQMEGKLELVDSNTEDVILSYNDFESAEATYAYLDTMGNGTYTLYIDLKLNEAGLEKINNIDSYKTTVADKNNDDKSEETSETETKVNNFKIIFDKDEIAEVSYDDILLNKKTLRIATAKDLVSDSTINSELNTNTIISKLATIGKIPVIYNITAEEYIKSDIVDYLEYFIIGIIVVCAIISIVLIIKYKLNGLLTVLSFVSNIAIFSIIIRLTNIEISLNGLAGIVGLILLNIILLFNILACLKNTDKTFSENIKNAYLKTINAFAITLIIFVVFSFSKMTVISSMGLLVFWGWFVTILGNLILTIPMLAVANKK